MVKHYPHGKPCCPVCASQRRGALGELTKRPPTPYDPFIKVGIVALGGAGLALLLGWNPLRG